jgi:phage terminase small subunit
MWPQKAPLELKGFSQMPRKTMTARTMGNLAVDGRPKQLEPPAGLSAREIQLFQHIVGSVQPEHFRPSDVMLLARYCESAFLAERAAVELRKNAVIDGKVNCWLIVQEKAIRAQTALSARLRLSPQSRLDQRTVARASVPIKHRPWLDDEENEDEDRRLTNGS